MQALIFTNFCKEHHFLPTLSVAITSSLNQKLLLFFGQADPIIRFRMELFKMDGQDFRLEMLAIQPPCRVMMQFDLFQSERQKKKKERNLVAIPAK